MLRLMTCLMPLLCCLAACGSAPALSDLGPTERAPICRAFGEEPQTGYGCRAEDVPDLRSSPAYQATVSFHESGRMTRFEGLKERLDDITAMHNPPPRCVDGEIKLLRVEPPRAVVVPIEIRYRAASTASRSSRLEGPRCVIDIAFAAP
jgi:hypothetical protein